MISEKELIVLQNAYYKGTPLMSDLEYDRCYNEFAKAHPDSVVVQRVGGDLINSFEEVEHSIPMLSLDKVYSIDELRTFMNKMNTQIVCEPKIDGISIVLYYKRGILYRAVTRGNGVVGNDVTENVSTINNVPKVLSRPIDVAVRGEIYLPKSELERLNMTSEVKYANCRNLTAGLMRHKHASKVKDVALDIFIYEGYYKDSPEDQLSLLQDLKSLGFKVNECFIIDSLKLSDCVEAYTAIRENLDYDIDGLVLKVNDTNTREKLGYTSHHPRWALAFKFESPQAVSIVEAIEVQIGRTGKATPVAYITPVEIAGSVISRVTLHNQDYIDTLDLGIGDTVSVSKHGDVIPAIDEVIEHESRKFIMPLYCPKCGKALVQRGAHLYCDNEICASRALNNFIFFAGRNQMNIDGLGENTIKYLYENFNSHFYNGSPINLYSFNYDMLATHAGFGLKKIAKIKKSLANTRNTPLSKVLASFGRKGLGHKNSKLLVDHFNNIGEILNASEETLASIHGIGKATAYDLRNSLIELTGELAYLDNTFLNLPYDKDEVVETTATFCITGSFEVPRKEIEKLIKENIAGSKIVSNVSKNLNYLVCGDKAGSKATRAQKLGVDIINLEELKALF